eukprot:3935678-Rhodomonas_salina.1
MSKNELQHTDVMEVCTRRRRSELASLLCLCAQSADLSRVCTVVPFSKTSTQCLSDPSPDVGSACRAVRERS